VKEQGRKFDGGKLRYDLIPAKALQEVVRVLTYGAGLYGDENWKNVPNGRKRYYAAGQRHQNTYWIGDEVEDKESKTHHLANAITDLLFILEKDLQGWEDVQEHKVCDSDSIENEWIDWNGGERPVDVFVRVSVRFRDGTQYDDNAACNWSWQWMTGNLSSEIVAYKVLD
jgi:hypothetical protein